MSDLKYIDNKTVNPSVIYNMNGYKDRDTYLHAMGEDYNVPYEVVVALSDLLGSNEDFDGLISDLKDYDFMFGGNQ